MTGPESFEQYLIIILSIVFYLVIPAITLGIVIPVTAHKRKYRKLVEQYSIAYKKILEINKRYSFVSIPSFDINHTYDNNDFYPTVSCRDHLIYKVARAEKMISKALDNVENNRFKFSLYSKEISSCHYGEFEETTQKYNLKTLKKYEKKIIQKTIKKPCTSLTMRVVLKRTDIGGNYKETKQAFYKEEDIKNVLTRVQDKRGIRYMDDGVWQSIVKVERAKVSNKMRFAVFARDHERCVKCGSRRNLEIDHIYPISKGGKTEMSNLQTLCHRCNVKKGSSIE